MTETEKALAKRITELEARLAYLEGRTNALEQKTSVYQPLYLHPYQPQWIGDYKVTCKN